MSRDFIHQDDVEEYPIHRVSRHYDQDKREFRHSHQAADDPSRVAESPYVYPFSRSSLPVRGPITAPPMVERPDFNERLPARFYSDLGPRVQKPDHMREGAGEFSRFTEPARRSENYRHAEVSAKTLPSHRFDRAENFGYGSRERRQTSYDPKLRRHARYDVEIERSITGTESSISESEEDDETIDISQALLDMSKEPASQENLPSPLQKESIEESPRTDVFKKLNLNPQPGSKILSTGNVAVYNAITSSYQNLDGIDNITGNIVHVEYLSSFPFPQMLDRSNFRWLHLNKQNMDFDLFSRAAQEFPGLPESTLLTLPHFMNRVRKDLETSIRSHRGVIGNFMKPAYINIRGDSSALDDASDSGYIFCSVPYTQLAQYSSLDKLPKPQLHPRRTLLQTKYPSTTMQRDLQQVVCNINGTPAGHCFHMPNLWCLIINDKFIVTCAGEISAQDLAGDRVNMTQIIPQPTSIPSPPSHLNVVFESRLYAIPLHQCDTWFKFTQNYVKYTLTFNDHIVVYWKGARVNAKSWPVVVQQARKELISLKLSQRKRPITHEVVDEVIENSQTEFVSHPHTASVDGLSAISEADSKAAVTPSDGHQSSNSIPDGSKSQGRRSERKAPAHDRTTSTQNNPPDLQAFHILVWLAIRQAKPKATVDNVADGNPKRPSMEKGKAMSQIQLEIVDLYLKSVHIWLESQKDRKLMAAYRKASLKSLNDIELALQGMPKPEDDISSSGITKKNFFEDAKSIFSLFIPLDQQGPMCSKVWGCLYDIATTPAPTEWGFFQLSSTFSEIANLARTIDSQLSDNKGPPPEELPMPPEALGAWQHYLGCLLLVKSKDGFKRANRHARKCLSSLRKAHAAIMKNPQAKKLEDTEAVRPTSLLTFILNRVLSDFTGTQPDIVDSYWEYFDMLEIQVEKDPLSRRNQAKITASITEIKIVLDTLNSQDIIVRQLEEDLFRIEGPQGRGMKIMQGPNPALINLQRSILDLEGKIASVEELLDSSRYLLERNMNAIRDNKDRQEAAIYAFTIVTIIFLPISTVASVFGMNTNDVRNMGQSQWLFWAAALPLTTLVIAVSLFAAGIIPWPLWPLSWSDKAVLVRAQSEVSETKMLPEMRTSTGFTGARRRGTLGRRYSDAS